MRKIQYPDPIRMSLLLQEYQKIFSSDINTLQHEWTPLRTQLRGYSMNPNCNSLYPDNINDIFIKSYPDLIDMYLDYIAIQQKMNNLVYPQLHESLKRVFHYSGEKHPSVSAYQPQIADFFMRHSKELGISVCYYCETSFVNTYGFSNIYKNFAEFLVNADISNFKRFIRNEKDRPYSESVIRSIYNLCHAKDMNTVVDEFDNYRYFKNKNPKKSECIISQMRNHFDLDHFLPKSICPLVALSFYNFVPSCSVCNEKLKRTAMIGETDKDKLLMLSPTSCDYKFDKEIKMRIVYNSGISTLRMQEHPDDFKLEFTPKRNSYQEIVEVFRLDERYNFHKQIALKQHDLYQDFAPGHINQLEHLFKGAKSYQEIENQIFRNEYIEDSARCFDKLKKDIKEQCGR